MKKDNALKYVRLNSYYFMKPLPALCFIFVACYFFEWVKFSLNYKAGINKYISRNKMANKKYCLKK